VSEIVGTLTLGVSALQNSTIQEARGATEIDEQPGRSNRAYRLACQERLPETICISGPALIQQTLLMISAQIILSLSLSSLLPLVRPISFLYRHGFDRRNALVLISEAQTLARKGSVVRIQAQFFTQSGRTLVLTPYSYPSTSRRMEEIVMIFSLESSG
jgi:hypothetical protein